MKVLVLEDDPFLQLDVAETVGALGHEVVGPFSKEAPAISALEDLLPDAALLDFNLGNERDSSRLADLLVNLGVPFAFSTGHTRNHLPDRFARIAIIEKPYRDSDISAFLARL